MTWAGFRANIGANWIAALQPTSPRHSVERREGGPGYHRGRLKWGQRASSRGALCTGDGQHQFGVKPRREGEDDAGHERIHAGGLQRCREAIQQTWSVFGPKLGPIFAPTVEEGISEYRLHTFSVQFWKFIWAAYFWHVQVSVGQASQVKVLICILVKWHLG